MEEERDSSSQQSDEYHEYTRAAVSKYLQDFGNQFRRTPLSGRLLRVALSGEDERLVEVWDAHA